MSTMRTVHLFLALCVILTGNLRAATSNRRLLLWAVDDNGCRTPDGKTGECIPISQCEPMVKILFNEIFDDKKKDRLKKYYCSFKNSIVSVCCPTEPTNLEWVFSDESCRTPDSERGSCVPIFQCKRMMDFLTKSGSTVDDKTKNVLRQYACRYSGPGIQNIHVCCPNKPIKVGEDTQDVVNKESLLPEDCGQSNTLDRITNGQKSDLYEFPWQVALKYESRKTPPYHCGASLINNRYVLTAAHCIRTLKLIGLRLGEYDFNTNPDCVTNRNKTRCAPNHIDFDISERDAIIHEGYTRQGIQNDIALIRLPREVSFTDAVGPVCLPFKDVLVKKDSEYRNLTVIGWGATETRAPSSVLLKVTVPYVTQSACQSIFKSQITISDKQICAGGRDGKDSCSGDSGGPIMYSAVDAGIIRWVQAGLVSFGTKLCGTETVPAVYTKLTAYKDWILENIQP